MYSSAFPPRGRQAVLALLSLVAACKAEDIVDTVHAPKLAFTIGGTVTGLAGSGLVLRNSENGDQLPVPGVTFTFTQSVETGIKYTVSVANQPNGPAQSCTVANGVGTMSGANVTNIVVTCVSLSPVASGLDTTFGSGGRVTTALDGAQAEGVALQDDGKVVVAGHVLIGGFNNFAVMRYNTDGTPDTTFGTRGVATVGFLPNQSAEAFDVAIQGDGKIVAAGDAAKSLIDVDFAIARFNPDGTLDTGFGNGGKVQTDFGGGVDLARSVIVEETGDIFVGGSARLNGDNDFAVARYNPAGFLVPTFGTNGRATTNVAGTSDLGSALALDAVNHKIILAGRAAMGTAQTFDVALVCYRTDGVVDATFGVNGRLVRDYGEDDAANGVVIQPDGKIVIAGYASDGGTYDFLVARFTPGGSDDVAFGTSGHTETDLSGNQDFAESVALDGPAIVLVGRRTSGTIFDLAVAIYSGLDGKLDTGFGTGGQVNVDYFGRGDFGQDIAIQSDRNIVVAGFAASGPNSTAAVVARVIP